MQLSELQTNVNYRRRDVTESFVSDVEITNYLNESLRRLHGENEWDFTKTSTTFSFTEGAYAYQTSAVASDMKEPISMFYTNSYQFERVTPAQFRRLSGSKMNMFSTQGDELLVSTTFGGETLEFYYYSTHKAKTSAGSWTDKLSTSTDSPLMPTRWHDSTVSFASARCYQKEGMTDDYNIAYAEFTRDMEKMKREYPSVKAKPLTGFKHLSQWGQGTQRFDRKDSF